MSVEDERKLFVAGLAEGVTEDVLRQLFEVDGGTVESATVPRDRATGLGRGFAFVTMRTAEEAEAARQALDGSLHDGRPISVRPFRGDRSTGAPPARAGGSGPAPRGPRPSGPPSDEASVYVGNLPYDATAQVVQQVFESMGFGPVQRIHLPTDPEGRPRGFGFVVLSDPEAARRAAEGMTHAQIGGRNISVSQARARGTKPPPRPVGAQPAGAPRPPRAFDEGAGGPMSSAGPRPEPRSIPPRFFEFDAGPNTRGDDERRARGAQPPVKKKEKKRKAGTQDRGPKRRDNEGFRSPRGRGMLDDWDDD